MAGLVCPSCGREVEDGRRFCVCGWAVPAALVPPPPPEPEPPAARSEVAVPRRAPVRPPRLVLVALRAAEVLVVVGAVVAALGLAVAAATGDAPLLYLGALGALACCVLALPFTVARLLLEHVVALRNEVRRLGGPPPPA